MKLAYQDEIIKNRGRDSGEVLDAFLHKKQGKQVPLDKKLDGIVQAYIRRVCKPGGKHLQPSGNSCSLWYFDKYGQNKVKRIWRPCGIEQSLGTFITESNKLCPENNNKGQIF